MDYMFALMRPLKCAHFGKLDLDNSPIGLMSACSNVKAVIHFCLAVYHSKLMKPWGKLSKTEDKVETLLLSCFSRRKLIFKVGKTNYLHFFSMRHAFFHFSREVNLCNFKINRPKYKFFVHILKLLTSNNNK